ncbi:MAG: hypothetical protein ACLQGP_16730 [Isosphaeraceae bacterium]
MTKARASKRFENKSGCQSRLVAPREYAGEWIAWSEDGCRIIVVGDSIESCEQAVTLAGFPPDQIAIERVPETRFRLTGSGM